MRAIVQAGAQRLMSRDPHPDSAAPARWRAIACLALALVTGCANIEEKRIAELLHEKGFGTRAQGVATLENYVAGGDFIQFLLDPIAQLQPGAEMLAALSVVQPVGIDGTIWVPYIGPMRVLGSTEAYMGAMVTELLQRNYQFPIKVQARIVANLGKGFYTFGEVGRRGRWPYPKPDFTLIEALTLVGWTPLANLGRVRLIRPDAENPLIVEVNFREMILSGITRYNLQLQENDIIYIPPTFFGALTRFIEKLLQPLRVVVQALLGITTIEYTYDVLTGNSPLLNTRFYF